MEDRNNSTLEQVLAVTVKPGSRKGPLVETGDDGALTIYVPERAIEGKATAAAARLFRRASGRSPEQGRTGFGARRRASSASASAKRAPGWSGS